MQDAGLEIPARLLPRVAIVSEDVAFQLRIGSLEILVFILSNISKWSIAAMGKRLLTVFFAFSFTLFFLFSSFIYRSKCRIDTFLLDGLLIQQIKFLYICLLTYLLICSFIHTANLCIYSFSHSIIHSFKTFIYFSFKDSFTHKFIHSLTHSLTHSFIHSLIYSFIHSFIHYYIDV